MLLEQQGFLTELSKHLQINEWIKLRTVCKAFNNLFSLEHLHHTQRHCTWTQKLFEEACRNQKIHIFKICPITPKIDPAAEDNWAIRWASSAGHLEVLKYLVSLKKEFPNIDPAANVNHAILWASSNGHLEVVKYLVSLKNEFPGIDPAANHNYAIRWASMNGNLEVVKYLISLKNEFPNIDPDAGDNHAIIWAKENGHLEVVNYLASLKNK